MSEPSAKRCRQPGCGGPASGVCIDQLPFEECPNVIEDPDIDEGFLEGGEAEEQVTDVVITSTGPSFTDTDCDAFLRRRPAILVALVAGPDAGKTTLISTIYELARRGLLQATGFAGSETILGFEERCHLSRQTSGIDQPDTDRTKVRGVRFLHLKLASEDRSTDYLFSDRAGENFTSALERPGVVASYEELVRAEHLILLVDGRQLHEEPHVEEATARRLFRSLVQAGITNDRTLHVVVTKTDLYSEEKLLDLRERATALVEDFKAQAPEANIMLALTGARARPGTAQFGEGISELILQFQPTEKERSIDVKVSQGPASGSMLDRLVNTLGRS